MSGTVNDAKAVFDAQTMGWAKTIIKDERGYIETAKSLDSKYTMTFRDFSSDPAQPPFTKINGTIDVQEFKVYDNGYTVTSGPKIEIKFGE